MGMLLKFFLCRACVEAKSTRHPIYITPDWHVSQRRVVFPLTFFALFQEVGREFSVAAIRSLSARCDTNMYDLLREESKAIFLLSLDLHPYVYL